MIFCLPDSPGRKQVPETSVSKAGRAEWAVFALEVIGDYAHLDQAIWKLSAYFLWCQDGRGAKKWNHILSQSETGSRVGNRGEIEEKG